MPFVFVFPLHRRRLRRLGLELPPRHRRRHDLARLRPLRRIRRIRRLLYVSARPQTRKTPLFSRLVCVCRVQTAAAATARCAVATAAEDATADTMTTVSINVHGPIPPPLWSLLVVAHPIADAPPRLALSLSLVLCAQMAAGAAVATAQSTDRATRRAAPSPMPTGHRTRTL